jgi:diguanylate cyclase (GGDEF)-like protein
MAKIVVVDDRATNRQYLTTLLGYYGHELHEASNGAEALDLVRRVAPDLVITDILMPTMDGYQFALQLRGDKAAPQPRLIFYTATYSAPAAHEMADSCGVDAVLMKPCDPADLVATVSRLLGVEGQHAAPLPEAENVERGTPALPADYNLAKYITRLQVTKRSFDKVVVDNLGSVLERELAAMLSEEFAADISDLRRLLFRLTVLIEVSTETSAERDPARIVEIFFGAACEIIPTRFAAIATFHDRDRSLRHLFAKDLPLAVLERNPLHGALGELVSGRQRSLRWDGTQSRAGMGDLPPGHPPCANLLAVAIAARGQTYGWLYFADRHGVNEFSEEDERFADILVEKLALLYENATFYDLVQQHAAKLEMESAQRAAAEATLVRLSRIREVLSSINSAIVRVHERGALFREACRIAVEAGGFALAAIAMRGRDSGDMTTVAASGPDAKLFRGVRREDEGDPVSEMMRTGQPAFCNDIAREERRGEVLERMLQLGYRSAIALPLTSGGEVVGLLELCSREPGVFVDDELLLLRELAGDISFALEYIAKSERLDYLAYYDAMTDLPNATLFQDRLGQLVRGATSETGRIAVVLFDLDRFSEVNDRFGRHAGDLLLKHVATRLSDAQGEPRTLARIGANRFAAAVAPLRKSADALDVVRQRVFEPLEQPFPIDGTEIRLSARAGIAIFPSDGTDAGTLVRHAEAALRQAQGAGRFHYYSADANARIAARLELERQLREAIDKRQFVLHYQPRVDLVSGLIVAAEALIRWQHPSRGLLDPDEFIPVAEQTGFIDAIGDWVIDAVCAQQAAWLVRHGATVPVALNLSAVQIGKDDFLDRLQQALAGRDLDRKYLEVELTESAVMENLDDAMRTLSALRALGIALSLDDFGTGYSSLAYLKQFPFNFVKIDKSFIAGIVHNPEDAIIARAIIALAHRLNLRVVAEGVENEAQVTYLRNNGCDEIQGYYFSRPVPAEDFGEMLQAGKRLELAPLASDEGACTILAVDGDAETLAALKRVLLTEACEVLTAQSGEQALEVLSLNVVQVIVCDQRMPGMSGTQFCSRVRSLHPDTVRIVLAGYADIEAVVDAVNRGVVYRFLTKPLDDRLLRAHVRDALRHYSAAARDESFSDRVA